MNIMINPYELIEEHLNEREKGVILHRYGPSGGKRLTQQEIGKISGISRSYVSHIEKKAMSTLKSFLPKTDDRNIY